MQMNYQFDATQYNPDQGSPTHPVGKFPATVTNTEVKANKDNTGGYLEVAFETPAGRLPGRYNLFSQSEQAKEIAHRQLSALCHATGIYKLDFNNEAASLRGARCMIEVGLQKGQSEGGYTELKRVFDVNGNEPGKSNGGQPAQNGFASPQPQPPQPPQAAWSAPQGQPPQPSAPPPQPQQAWSAPQQQPPAGNATPWGAPPAQQQPPQPQAGAPWAGGPPAAPPPQPQQAPVPQAGWQQGNGAGAPPWGPR